jgi:hypothetical protein
MLQFINENSDEKHREQQEEHSDNPDDLTVSSNKAAEEQDEQNVQTEQKQDYLTVANRDSKVKRGTIVLAIAFTIGLLCVLFMIKKSSPSTAIGQITNEESKIESAISQLTGLKMGIGSRIDQIVKRFNQFSDVKQLQVEQLQKNPFVRDKYFPASGLTTEIDNKAGAEALNSELARQAERMQLFSIMHSSQGNCCMIDDKVLYEGDRIGGFEVCRISDNEVELCAEGMKFVLRIPSEF